mgnify:CR=1 FL=1
MLLLLDVGIIIATIIIDKGEPEIHEETTAGKALAIASLVILSIFLVESALRLLVFGYRFFLNFWCLLDASVVIASMILEILVSSYALLIIIMRVWRIVRIFISIVFSIEESIGVSKAHHDEKVGKLKKEIHQFKHGTLEKLQHVIEVKDDNEEMTKQVQLIIQDLSLELQHEHEINEHLHYADTVQMLDKSASEHKAEEHH